MKCMAVRNYPLPLVLIFSVLFTGLASAADGGPPLSRPAGADADENPTAFCGGGGGYPSDASSVSTGGGPSLSPSPETSPRGPAVRRMPMPTSTTPNSTHSTIIRADKILNLPALSTNPGLDRLKKLILAMAPTQENCKKLKELRFPDTIATPKLPFKPSAYIPIIGKRLPLTQEVRSLEGLSPLVCAANAGISFFDFALVDFFSKRAADDSAGSNFIREFVANYPETSLFPTNDTKILAIRLGCKARKTYPLPPGESPMLELAELCEAESSAIARGLVELQALYIVTAWTLDYLDVAKGSCPLLNAIQTLLLKNITRVS